MPKKSAPGKGFPPHDDPQARLIAQIFEQLKGHLPIKSFDTIVKKVGKVTVNEQKLPLELVAPHVSPSLFPIETAEDLEKKLDQAIRSTVGLARSGRVKVTSKAFSDLLLETDGQLGKGFLPAPRRPYSFPIRMRSIVELTTNRDEGGE